MLVDLLAIALLGAFIATGFRLGPLRRLLTLSIGLLLSGGVLVFRTPISDASLILLGAARDALPPGTGIRPDVWQFLHYAIPWLAIGVLLMLAWACARALSATLMLNLPLADQLDRLTGIVAGTGVGLTMVLALVNIVTALSIARDDGPWDELRRSSVDIDVVCQPPIIGCF